MGRPRIELPREFTFRTSIPVRITDINYGGHLGNDAVLSIMQEARVRFLGQFGFSEKDVGEGVGIIVTEAHVQYRAEAFYGDQLLVDVCVDTSGRARYEFVYRLARGDTEIARGITRIACFDYGVRKVRPMPAGCRAALGLAE